MQAATRGRGSGMRIATCSLQRDGRVDLGALLAGPDGLGSHWILGPLEPGRVELTRDAEQDQRPALLVTGSGRLTLPRGVQLLAGLTTGDPVVVTLSADGSRLSLWAAAQLVERVTRLAGTAQRSQDPPGAADADAVTARDLS